jgi:hypothetical protein
LPYWFLDSRHGWNIRRGNQVSVRGK